MNEQQLNTVLGTISEPVKNRYILSSRKEVEEMTLAEVCKLLGKEIKIIK